MSSPSSENGPVPTKTIGGWLLLVGLGVVFTPPKIVFSLFSTFPPIFSNGTWEALTTKGSAVYSPIWGPVLIGEIVISIVLFLISSYLVYLFFTRKAVFPGWYLGAAVFSTLFVLSDAVIVSSAIPELTLFDPETLKELAKPLISLMIWSPYLLISQRSKETFIR